MFDIISLFAAELEDSKISMYGKGLRNVMFLCLNSTFITDLIFFTHYYTVLSFTEFYRPWERDLLKTSVGKGENADEQHFLLFSQCFLCYQRYILYCKPNLINPLLHVYSF